MGRKKKTTNMNRKVLNMKFKGKTTKRKGKKTEHLIAVFDIFKMKQKESIYYPHEYL